MDSPSRLQAVLKLARCSVCRRHPGRLPPQKEISDVRNARPRGGTGCGRDRHERGSRSGFVLALETCALPDVREQVPPRQRLAEVGREQDSPEPRLLGAREVASGLRDPRPKLAGADAWVGPTRPGLLHLCGRSTASDSSRVRSSREDILGRRVLGGRVLCARGVRHEQELVGCDAAREAAHALADELGQRFARYHRCRAGARPSSGGPPARESRTCKHRTGWRGERQQLSSTPHRT